MHSTNLLTYLLTYLWRSLLGCQPCVSSVLFCVQWAIHTYIHIYFAQRKMTRDIKTQGQPVRSKTHKARRAFTAASKKEKKKKNANKQIDKQWEQYVHVHSLVSVVCNYLESLPCWHRCDKGDNVFRDSQRSCTRDVLPRLHAVTVYNIIQYTVMARLLVSHFSLL